MSNFKEDDFIVFKLIGEYILVHVHGPIIGWNGSFEMCNICIRCQKSIPEKLKFIYNALSINV